MDLRRAIVAAALVALAVLAGPPARAHSAGCEGQVSSSERSAHCTFESTGGVAYVEALTANGSVLMECVLSYEGCVVNAPHPTPMVMAVDLLGPEGMIANCNTNGRPLRCEDLGDAWNTTGITLQCKGRLEDPKQNSLADVTVIASFRCGTRD